ncbi:V-type proton ATPase subunit C 2, partial [Galemys pyrenaicus]
AKHSLNIKFTIPAIKVNLNSLLTSDQLDQLDIFAKSLIEQMVQSVVNIMEDTKGKVQETSFSVVTSFITHFECEIAKYSVKQMLVCIVDTLAKQLAQFFKHLRNPSLKWLLLSQICLITESTEDVLITMTLFENLKGNGVARLLSNKKQQYQTDKAKMDFSELFVTWIHLELLRVYLYSLLSYGLPWNFEVVFFQSHNSLTA